MTRGISDSENGSGWFQIMKDYTEAGGLKLGFGLMRLPKNADGSIDIPQVCRMADLFLEAGGTYFDTAFVYDGGESEKAFKTAVADRYPRDRYALATKLYVMAAKDGDDARQQLATSLSRTGAGYIDYYLLHAIQRNSYRKYDAFRLWDFVAEQKARGLIKHMGFSFHADSELLEELLTRHPEVDFVQLQINYADWDNPGVASRRNWEICRAHGKPVTVMEPVKGGILADPPQTVKEVFDRAGGDLSYAGWALRFVADLDGLCTILSGMSSISQMEDNLRTMRRFRPLNDDEREIIRRAQAALDAERTIPCTACHYCTKDCPKQIPIPEIFTVANRKKGSPGFRTAREYNIVTQGRGKAGECLRCGRCEAACPQHLPVIRLLEQCREMEG